MKYFAQLNGSNVVTNVCSVNDQDAPTEQDGVAFLKAIHGQNTVWAESKPERKNMAGIGYTYNSNLDCFIPIKPYNSFVFDEELCRWVAPVPMPSDGLYTWNEASQSWVKLINS